MAKVIEMKGGWKSAADFNLQANRSLSILPEADGFYRAVRSNSATV